MELEKFNGVWVKDSTEGDITDWLSFMGVGFVMRQAAWAMSYGKGLLKHRLAIKDGLLCEEVLVGVENEGLWWCGSRAKLDGSRHKVASFEGAPLVAVQNYWREARFTERGIEQALFTLDGERYATGVRSISEDGNTMTTELVSYNGDVEYNIKTVHLRDMEATPPVMENMPSFCPITVYVEPEGSPYTKSAISESLEDYFPSVDECFNAMVKFFKELKWPENEKESTCEEVSATEFVRHITHLDDAKADGFYTADKDAGVLNFSYMRNDAEFVRMTYHVHKDPVRLEVSATCASDEGKLACSHEWAQRIIIGILPRSE
mmetsp:Transcript_76817/g.199597  ORF Transcript_76817/g.199597 Transcript_76817/m.199597 type:complete len:319 (+) Transcript_76817:79-1035(+)